MRANMSEILAFISQEAVNRKLTSEDIAAHFAYDKHHFSRTFKEINGFSVAEYLSSLKVEKAISQIDAKKRIIDVQDKAGFESSGSFTNTFKKYTGSSPKQYKTEMTEMFMEVKGFENNPAVKALEHCEANSESFCLVTIDLPSSFSKGIIFIGLFHTLIPNHKPISGIASKTPTANLLKNIPNGNYYLLACAIDQTTNMLSYFNLQNCLRGKVMEKLSFPDCSGKTYTITLRPPIPEDPPILVNLAKLLISSLKNTI